MRLIDDNGEQFFDHLGQPFGHRRCDLRVNEYTP